MTKEQFDTGIREFKANGARAKAFAVIGPGEDNSYLIMIAGNNLYQEAQGGILIKQQKNFFYLPYEAIILLYAMQ